MKRPLMHCVMAGSLLFGVFTASADDNELFDDRFYVAPMGAVAGSRVPHTYDDAWGGALAIGKSVAPHFGVELVGDYLHYRGQAITTPTTGLLCGLLSQCPDQTSKIPSRSIYGGGVGANYYFHPDNAGIFVHANIEGGDRFVYNAGLGLDQPVFNRAVYFRVEALYHKETGNYGEPLFHAGVRVPFGGLHEPVQAAPPPQTEVVPVEQPATPAEPAPAPEPAAAPCQPPAPGQRISLEGCKIGDTIVLRGVNFEFNKATLTVNAKTLLDEVADALLARKDIKVEIDGHTDGKGSDAYNQKLSEARAASVMRYLAGRGVEPGRMASKGYGKSMPIADNATDEGRELNRRVELKVTDSGSAAQTDEGQPAAAVAVAVPAPAPAPAKKHAVRRHKKAASSGTVSAAEAGPGTEQAPPSPEPAPAPAPQEVAPASSPAASEAAAHDQSTPQPAASEAALPAQAPASTEQAPAPPEAAPAPVPPDAGSASGGPAAQDQPAPPPTSSPGAAPPEGGVQTEQAPAPPQGQ